jgi:transposase
MRDNDGRKLDHATLEAMRTRAVEQIQAGAHPEDVAAVWGLHRSTVFGWVATYREGGADAVRARPVRRCRVGHRSCPVSRCAGCTG